MGSKFRSDLIKLLIFVVVSVLITLSVVGTLLDLKLGQPQTTYHAIFTNATDLEPGDVVRIAGVEVGKVSGVSVYGDDQAKVDFSVDSSQHLTTSTIATIQFENLLGQRYLQISAGRTAGTALRGGSTIQLANTRPGLDLTTVFTGFQPLLSALDPTQVNELTGSIIQVLQGQSGAVGNLVNETASLTTNLASKQGLINQIIDNLSPLLTSVNQDDTQLKQLIDGLDTLVTGLAGQRAQIGDAVTGLSNLSNNTNGLLDKVQPTLDQDLADLRTVTGILTANQGKLNAQLGNALQGLPALLNALDKVSSSGNYLAVYICDLTISTTNPISVKLSPGVDQSPPLGVPGGVIGNQAYHTPVCTLGAHS
ncbi:MAG TPA: MCE family protein [Acidimicrobiales bacterium]|nr:MCE family protein [Acidimicrobiales bacterium]